MSAKLGVRLADPDLVTRMKALGDPLRWSVVRLLSEGERCVCDLESEIGIGQSRLSYHLGILREAGLISDRKSGRWVYYSLVPEAVEDASSVLGTLSETWRNDGMHRSGSAC